MSEEKLTGEQALNRIQTQVKNAFKTAWGEVKDSFTKEDEKEFEDLTLKYAEAQITGTAHQVESWQCDIKAFLAREAREKSTIIYDRFMELLVQIAPIVRAIAMAALGV